MTRLVFKIQGMDCPEEVAVLRRAVGPVVGGADYLSCDLLNGTMTVSLPEGATNPGPIIQAVRKTGMHASLWQEEMPLGDNHNTGKSWQRWGRPLLCLLSALVPGEWDGVAGAQPGARASGPHRQCDAWDSHAPVSPVGSSTSGPL
jgi:hypothetical protein